MEKPNIFNKSEKLECSCCGKDLFEDIKSSMVIIATDNENNIVSVKPCCKGKCDKAIISNLPKNSDDGWKELYTFVNPYLYLKHTMAMFNKMYEGKKFMNEESFENYKQILLCAAPYVMRDLTNGEKESASLDDMIPF